MATTTTPPGVRGARGSADQPPGRRGGGVSNAHLSVHACPGKSSHLLASGFLVGALVPLVPLVGWDAPTAVTACRHVCVAMACRLLTPELLFHAGLLRVSRDPCPLDAQAMETVLVLRTSASTSCVVARRPAANFSIGTTSPANRAQGSPSGEKSCCSTAPRSRMTSRCVLCFVPVGVFPARPLSWNSSHLPLGSSQTPGV